ncbi:hypothetical protein [Bathymodiolus platifrons methanotrophic gill symbiont]|uniref:hypothetical protein n=1 Tax=Bathymodiolus platifrons methanotrophic gill symbiont TaxID=113268 RepID=UPI001C8E6317|nr:hypothetical protein [Bathymodiolus platifrons methanotrophic gill symbiont]
MATTNGSTAIRDKILASLAHFGLATTLRLLETIIPSGADSGCLQDLYLFQMIHAKVGQSLFLCFL